MQFQDLNLIDPLLRAVHAEGYNIPTPIQQQAIPYVLEGRDLIGCAQTGTGKTAAFALPILQHLANSGMSKSKDRPVRALILTPTRELAAQIGQSFAVYGRNLRLFHAVVFGGVGQNPQVRAMQRGVDTLIATPGRLLDLMNQGVIRLDKLEIFVLDEADRMLDMGFIHDVRRIIKALPRQRQTLLFSATMPQAIQELADQILNNPAHVEVTPQGTTVETITQSVFFVNKKDKHALLEHLLTDTAIERALVFTRTKHGANKLAEKLDRAKIRTDAIHGNKSQSARQQALDKFKAGKIRVLVATDIAARGIDVDDITHVINYDLPHEPESYVHRIGRTARAGASGIAFSFCDVEERKSLRDIEKLIRRPVPVADDHPFLSLERTEYSSQPSSRPPQRRSPGNGSQRQGRHGSGNGSNGSNGNGRSNGSSSNKWRRNRPGGGSSQRQHSSER